MTLNRKNFEDLINFLILIVLILAFLITASKTGLLTSGFRYLIDDHQIPLMYNDLKNKGLIETIFTWINYDRSLSRFRPYYQIQIVALTQLFGLNSVIWFLYINILGSLTAFFLFFFGRLLNFSVPISLVFSISTLLGSQSEIWIRPLIPDSQGMFFLSITLVFLGLSCKYENHSRLNNIFLIIFTILMSLSKESYIIFIPTLISLKIWLFSSFRQVSLWKAIKSSKISLICLTSILTLEVSYIMFFLGTRGTGYAGVDKNSLQFSAIISTINVLLRDSFFLITFICIVLLLILSRLNKESIWVPIKELFPFSLFFLIALIPHVLLYSKSGISAGFYLFPFIAISCLFLAKTLSLIDNYSKWLNILILSILCILLISKFSLAWGMYSQQANDSKAINSLLKKVKQCTPNNQAVLVVVNPRVRYEVADALQRVLRNTANKNNLLVATYGLEKTNFYSETLKNDEKNWNFLEPEAVVAMYQNRTILNTKNKNSIKAVIIFDELDDDFIKTNQDWFFPKKYRSTSFNISFAQANLYCKDVD
ncbi:MAG: hypothetical protein VKL41_03325 [Snowella sp.]|nr:hypothetical protein [Snowella sp.]